MHFLIYICLIRILHGNSGWHMQKRKKSTENKIGISAHSSSSSSPRTTTTTVITIHAVGPVKGEERDQRRFSHHNYN